MRATTEMGGAPRSAEFTPIETNLSALSAESLRQLHRSALRDPVQVRALLDEVCAAGIALRSGVDHRSAALTAKIAEVSDSYLRLQTDECDFGRRPQIYFQFELGGSRYFFAAPPRVSDVASGLLEVALPAAVYEAERRDICRGAPGAGAPTGVELEVSASSPVRAAVRDWSYQGLAVALPEGPAARLKFPLRVRFLDGVRAGEVVHASLCHSEADPARSSWTRLGLAISAVPPGQTLIPLERRESILASPGSGNGWRQIAQPKRTSLGTALRARKAGSGSTRQHDVVNYRNDAGESIRAIIDRTGFTAGATAVVIPPAWGRTKETTLPLAATLIETFEQAGEPVAVMRFDGTHRAGESYIAPEYRDPGNEYLGFRFSRAAGDIDASLDFLDREPSLRPSKVILVTFSLGAIEGRHALARHSPARVAGWVSTVGMVDLQSGLRSVSGGVDFAFGYMRGVRFGRHELVGVVADMDRTGQDALDHEMVFLEDARRDMARIDIPVTWIHGRYDGWMDLDRVRVLLSSGDTSARRLIEVPTGHQMRTSREALETFQLIAQEASEMALGRRLKPAAPNLVEFVRQEKVERGRRPMGRPDLKIFWRDYLVGRDQGVGIELLTATTAYVEFMAAQIRLLRLHKGMHVVDLGSGAGDFPVQLMNSGARSTGLVVTAIDYVPEALKRGRSRLAERSDASDLDLRHVLGDLDPRSSSGIPLRKGSADAVLASLLISYLEDPAVLLETARGLLKSGGRLVVSSLRRDADISKIYRDGVAELPPDRVEELFGPEKARRIQSLQRKFINNAARILNLEESGEFRFWDQEELVDLVGSAGFTQIEVEPAFGDPPQAIILSARKE